MGAVYEAEHRTLGRRVAIKVLHSLPEDASLARDAIARFEREGRAAVAVRHPHVVDVFDCGVADGVPYLAMELVDGESLAQRLRREGRLRLDEAVALLLPILSAVADLHAVGITHRDLKPANILLARGADPAPKVADFGVSRIDDGSPATTHGGALVGTPGYIAPELARAAARASELSDQYALGVVLYECTTGQRPHPGDTTEEILRSTARAEVRPPSHLEPALAGGFDAVVLRAMAADPARRFASVDELAVALLPFASAQVAARWRAEFEGPSVDAAAPRLPPRSAARARVAVLALAGALLVSTVAVWTSRSRAGAQAARAGTTGPSAEAETLAPSGKLAVPARSVASVPSAPPSASSPGLPPTDGPATPVESLPIARVSPRPSRDHAMVRAAAGDVAGAPTAVRASPSAPPVARSLGANGAPILEIP
jgi:serine/threonine-protein kinase